jgi:predicted O-methyltransferase YrrM
MSVMQHFALWAVGLAKAETQTSEDERACLVRFASGKRRLAEIGVWHGVTTGCLRRVMASDGVLLCIDPFLPGRLGFSAQRVIARSELSRIRNGQLRWIRTTGREAGLGYDLEKDGPIEFLFIDGDHTYEALRDDWQGWSPLMTTGGIVCLHDSCSSASRQIDNAGSAIFAREVIAHDSRYERIEVVDTLTVLRRHE